MGVESVLVPTRFLATMGHLTAVLMLFWTKEKNIERTLPLDYTESEFDDKNSDFLAVLWLSVICFTVELLSLFAGITLFHNSKNAFHIFAHFMGGILMCWFIIESWHYAAFVYVFVFFSLLPALLEVSAIMSVFCCKVVQY